MCSQEWRSTSEYNRALSFRRLSPNSSLKGSWSTGPLTMKLQALWARLWTTWQSCPLEVGILPSEDDRLAGVEEL